MAIYLLPAWQTRLACPRCHMPLDREISGSSGEGVAETVACRSCGAIYQAKDGIINFGVVDAFYDEHGFTSTGRDFSSSLIGKLGLYFARHHFLYEISRAVVPGSAVIEIGCGGGSRYLASRYDMLGVEVSTSSVRRAAQIYSSVVQTTVAELPLVDGCADAVVSSFVLEHLGNDDRKRCLSEMVRVLRPGGIMIHYFDLDTEGPFWAWAKRQPWHERIFVTSKGHFGLRGLEEWRDLFRRAGFEIQASQLFCKTWLQDLSIWAALDDPSVSGVARNLGKAAGAIYRSSGWVSDVIVTIIHDGVERWLPDRWAAKAIMRLRKRS